MTIFGLSGVGLALAATLTATAVWGLPGEDVTGAGTGVAPVGAEPVPADPREPGVGNDPSPAPADPLVSFAFEDTPLRDILAMLSRDTGWSFTVEPDADDLPLVTLSAQDMKLSSAVQWLAAMTKTTITPVPPSDDGAL